MDVGGGASNLKHEIRNVKDWRGCVEVCRQMLIRLRTVENGFYMQYLPFGGYTLFTRRDSSSLNVLVDRVDSLSMVV